MQPIRLILHRTSKTACKASPQNDIRDHRRPTRRHWPPTNTPLYNYTRPIHTSPAFGASRLFCCRLSSPFHRPQRRKTKTPQRTPAQSQTSTEAFTSPKNPKRVEFHNISTRKHTTPAMNDARSTRLDSCKPSRHQEPPHPRARKNNLGRSPEPHGASRTSQGAPNCQSQQQARKKARASYPII